MQNTLHVSSSIIHANTVSTKSIVPRPALRDAGEVAAIFGYKNAGSLHSAVSDGLFPKPDVVIVKMNGMNKKGHWTLTLINRELKKRKLKSK